MKVGQIILQKHILKKKRNFSKKIKDRKQLEMFLQYLTYASDFINDLPELSKPLQHKLKKELSQTWTLAIQRLFKTLRRRLKIFLFLIYLMKKMI